VASNFARRSGFASGEKCGMFCVRVSLSRKAKLQLICTHPIEKNASATSEGRDARGKAN
jgi:hypothetical protein